MKLKAATLLSAFLLTGICSTTFLTSCNSSGSGTTASKENNKKVIKDEKLYPFLLGGVYFFHGYNGANAIMTQMKSELTEKPGSDAFTKELQKTYDELFIYPFKPEDGAGAKSTLAEWWDIKSKDDFLKTQQELLAEGHQKKYEAYRKALDENGGAQADVNKIDIKKYKFNIDAKEQLTYIKNNYAKFSKAGIKAWDFARYVNNTCMGYAAGYVSKEEGYELLNKLAPMAKQQYDNWATYFNDWNLGRGFWGGDNSESFDADVKAIQDTTNQYNIYNYMPIK